MAACPGPKREYKTKIFRASGEASLGTQRYFNKALYTSTLTKHFTQALYPSTLSKHFIQALHTSTLSKHFTQGITKVLQGYYKGITKVLQRYYKGITNVFVQLTYRGEVLRRLTCFFKAVSS